MKIKKNLLFLATIFAAGNVAAQDVVPSMLAGNPEWSYYMTGWELTGLPERIIETYFYHFYLSGTTEINGRQYVNVCCEWDEGTHYPYCFDNKIENNVVMHFREDDGRILAPLSDFPDIDFHPFLGGKTDEECILYDWNLQDEKFPIIQVCLGEEDFLGYNNIKRLDESITTLDGIARGVWRAQSGGRMIEGIGSIESTGLLTKYLSSYSIPIGYFIENAACLNVFVQDGQVIYKAPDYQGDPEQEEESATTYKPDPYFGKLITTGIAPTLSSTAFARSYDLSGRPAAGNNSGVRIEEGRKVMR